MSLSTLVEGSKTGKEVTHRVRKDIGDVTELGPTQSHRGGFSDAMGDRYAASHVGFSENEKELAKEARRGKHTKDGALLVSVAESIGSTLGTIAAKADAAQKALTRNSIAHTVERKGKKPVRKSKRVARRNAAAANLKISKLARATRRGLRSATSSAKRAARRGAAKARAARLARTRR